MTEEKVWIVRRSGGVSCEKIKAEKVRFLGDGGRCLKLVTRGQVKAVYAAGAWSSVHLEGALVKAE